MAWFRGKPKDLLLELPVALLDCFLFVPQQAPQLLGVFADGIGKAGELEGNDLGVRQPQDGGAIDLGQGAPINEVRVQKWVYQ